MSQPYSYCVLKYRHDLLTEEFVNVGVLLFAPKAGYMRFLHTRRWQRLTDFFGKQVNGRELVEALRQYAAGFNKIAKACRQSDFLRIDPHCARSLGERVIPHDDSALQWSRMGGGLAENLDATLEELYYRFIGRFECGRDDRSRNDKQVWDQSLGRVFAHAHVLSELTDVKIVAPLDSYHFKHAWKNGKWHLFEPVSFDLADGDGVQSKALKWFGRATQLQKSEEKFGLHLVLGRPKEKRLLDDYKRACDVLSTAGAVNLVEENHAEEFGLEYARLIKSHSVH